VNNFSRIDYDDPKGIELGHDYLKLAVRDAYHSAMS
jgi:hypothetical protein